MAAGMGKEGIRCKDTEDREQAERGVISAKSGEIKYRFVFIVLIKQHDSFENLLQFIRKSPTRTFVIGYLKTARTNEIRNFLLR